ncbi:MAG TPA: hypothetical protein VK906_17950 [Egicoccus sp.]|nr:hypothetical protein [Egicoccus sp.]HSK25074.1 hypothetical protein [Egicoccus sp.]
MYGVALDEFTAERDRRVKELKAQGHKELAAALKAHRKPTVPAWAVDQVTRRHGERVEALIEAADDLRALQHRAASGRRADGMREASLRLRDLVGDLREAAGRILTEAGTRADAHLDEVEQTIFAAAVDPAHHDALRRGTFATALPGAGFGGLGFGLSVLPDPPDEDDDAAADDAYDETAEGLAAAAEAAAEAAAARQDEADRRADEEHAAAKAREAEQTRAAEQKRSAEAQRELSKRRRALERRIDALTAARDKQADRAVRAREEADDLQGRADAARAEADAVESDLADYDDDLAAARAELDALDTP